jgi:hypothetical protein
MRPQLSEGGQRIGNTTLENGEPVLTSEPPISSENVEQAEGAANDGDD